MSDYFYDGQIKRYLVQFMRLMSNFSYKDAKGNLVEVPVRYGDMNRQVANVLKKNSENLLNSAPFIACYISDVQYDRERMQDPTYVNKLNIRERAFDEQGNEYLNIQGANYTVERIMPTPYKMTFAADIWTTNTDQKLQLWEQITVLFNPSLEIQTTDNYIDWTSLSLLELTSQRFESRSVPQGLESDISIANLTFTAPIWISPPVKVKKLGIITKIIASVFVDPTGTISSGEYSDIGLTNIFEGKTPVARTVITPGNYELLVLNNVATLVNPTEATKDFDYINELTTKPSWLRILDLYPGQFQAGLSQIRLLKPDGNEIVAYISLNPTDETKMQLNFDNDTIPTNTLIPDLTNNYIRGTIDAIVDPTTFNPVNPIADTRYLILEDINQKTEDPDGPQAWKNSDNTDFKAFANDIIQWDGTNWNIIFNSQESTDLTYITNIYTGIQYKWENNQWSKSFEGLYSNELWRLIL